MSKRDYYEVLGLTRGASDDDIKKAYRKLAMQYHPDRNNDADKVVSEAKFKEVKEAYECLSDQQRKSVYDVHGHQENTGNRPGPQWTHTEVNINDLFKSMFADHPNMDNIFGQQFRQQPKRNIINLTLEESYVGKSLRMPGGQTANLPAGVRDGTKFFVDSQIYQIAITPHAKFKRSNDDLLVDVDINAIEAMLGLSSILTHLDNVKLEFTIPAGIQHGQIVRLAAKGMKNPELNQSGDLLIRISVTTPRDLSDAQKALLKTFPQRELIHI